MQNEFHDNSEADPMELFYDFSHGIRGRHHLKYLAGHAVRITPPDGSVEESNFAFAAGAILPDPAGRSTMKPFSEVQP